MDDFFRGLSIADRALISVRSRQDNLLPVRLSKGHFHSFHHLPGYIKKQIIQDDNCESIIKAY
jgi:hypothetical protein